MFFVTSFTRYVLFHCKIYCCPKEILQHFLLVRVGTRASVPQFRPMDNTVNLYKMMQLGCQKLMRGSFGSIQVSCLRQMLCINGFSFEVNDFIFDAFVTSRVSLHQHLAYMVL